MNTGKFSHTFIGWLATIFLGSYAWAIAHFNILLSIIVAGFAIRASLWTAKAAKETIRNKREERERNDL